MGLLFIISAPAGTGKTTLVSMLLNEFANVARSVSYTTREKRADEVDGQDYFFIDRGEFDKRIEKGEFLEYAEVFGNLYGTSKKFVEEKLKANKHVVLVIDTQGAMKLQSSQMSNDAVFIFVRPPSLEEQKKRLLKRHTENEEAIETRLLWAQEELQVAKDYDYQIVNEDLIAAYEVLKSIIIAEEHRTCHFRQFSTKKG
jgi:guanylate kinase